eukprot:Lankesteria_metandrocarpae@DN9258_c0_g1_i1.p1
MSETLFGDTTSDVESDVQHSISPEQSSSSQVSSPKKRNTKVKRTKATKPVKRRTGKTSKFADSDEDPFQNDENSTTGVKDSLFADCTDESDGFLGGSGSDGAFGGASEDEVAGEAPEAIWDSLIETHFTHQRENSNLSTAATSSNTTGVAETLASCSSEVPDLVLPHYAANNTAARMKAAEEYRRRQKEKLDEVQKQRILTEASARKARELDEKVNLIGMLTFCSSTFPQWYTPDQTQDSLSSTGDSSQSELPKVQAPKAVRWAVDGNPNTEAEIESRGFDLMRRWCHNRQHARRSCLKE